MNWDEPYPWQIEAWDHFDQSRRAGRVAHALLVSGAPGLGKRHFAELVAARLLCAGSDEQSFPCRSCRACRLLHNASHPDFRRVQPLDGRSSLIVEQIREVSAFLALTSQTGGHKVVIIHSAERMNVNAANCLLKTLEEPEGASLLLLVTGYPGRLPATIRSRCQKIRIQRPDDQVARDWLGNGDEHERRMLAQRLAGGGPLLARQLMESGYLERRLQRLAEFRAVVQQRSSPLEVAQQWAEDPLDESLRMLIGWIEDMITVVIAGRTDSLKNLDALDLLHDMARDLPLSFVFARLDEARKALNDANSPVSNQLLLESLLIAWTGRMRALKV